jgi:hypothetical protein
VRQLADALDQLVAVAGLGGHVVKDQQRQQPRAAEVADQRVARDRSVRDFGPLGHPTDDASAAPVSRC